MKLTRGAAPSSTSVTAVPSRIGISAVASRSTSCNAARLIARQPPTPSQNRSTSISASRRPRWSRNRCRPIGLARAATAGPMPSSPSPRTALPGRYKPVPVCVPLGHSLDDLAADVALTKGAGERETGDTGPDDQHTHRGHRRPPSVGCSLIRRERRRQPRLAGRVRSSTESCAQALSPH